MTEIDRIPTSHRLRWADIYGNGKKVAGERAADRTQGRSARLSGQDAAGFLQAGHVDARNYSTRTTKACSTASSSPIGTATAATTFSRPASPASICSGLARTARGRRTELTKGDPSSWPNCGSSDVTVGSLGGKASTGGKAKTRFLAAIEPWHGNEVAVYRQDIKGKWQRQVIDDALVQGHTILTADLNGDGIDEIVAGYRGKGSSVNVYYANGSKGERWTNHPVDSGGMAASSCAAADLNADGKIDLVCIGSATTNLKWYENKGPRK